MPFEFNLPEEDHQYEVISAPPANAMVIGVEETFSGHLQRVQGYLDRAKDIVVEEEKETDKMIQARTIRLEIRKVRIQIEKDRKEYKEDLLRKSQFIDRTAKEIKTKLEEAEIHLKAQEEFIKIQEEKRKQARYRHRVDHLKSLGLNDIELSAYNLMDIDDIRFEEIIKQVEWKINEKKKAEEEEKKRVEEEKKRQAEIEAENRRLREEIEAEKAKAEKAKREAEEVKAKAEKLNQVNPDGLKGKTMGFFQVSFSSSKKEAGEVMEILHTGFPHIKFTIGQEVKK